MPTLVSALCGSELGVGDVLVATTKQDGSDSSNPWSTARPQSRDCPVTPGAAVLAQIDAAGFEAFGEPGFGKIAPRCARMAPT